VFGAGFTVGSGRMVAISKISNLLRLNAGLVQVTAGNTGASVIGGLFWLFIASLMTVEEYGKLNYLLSLSSIFAAVSLLGLQNTVITYVAKGNHNLKLEANFVVLISNILATPFLFLLTENLAVLLSLVGLSFFNMSWAEMLGEQRYKRFSATMLSQKALQVVLSALLYFVFGVDGIIAGYGVSTLVFAYNFFRSVKGFRPVVSELRQHKSFIVHSYSASISNSITNFADKLLVGPLFGFAVLGLYQISFQFLMFLYVIPLSVFQFMLPRESLRRVSAKVVAIALGGAIALSIIFFVAIPTVMQSFFPRYIESVESARIMIFGVVPMTVNAIMVSRLLGTENSRPVLFATLIYIFTLSILVFVLGTEMGLPGLAVAVLCSLSVQTLALVALPRLLRPSIPTTA
jgi:O-antigen/teichoic acid export membrane protein